MKDALRVRFQAYRADLAPEAVAARSASIIDRLQALPVLQAAETIHCYWPMVDRGEIDTRPFIRQLHTQGTRVVLPVVTRFAKGRPQMEHRTYHGPTALRPNRWGIHEPVDTPTVSPHALDAVIVPALGAGRNGHRIGHGRGYYDAFLAPLDVPTVALVYEACLVNRVPAAPHDVPMTAIVTEQSIVRPPVAA